ncbi:aminotransferase class I/II-fold pyridoxal phosphate-dependent enzyme [Lutibacter sp. A64]|uniref:pyridoxal phosphate-dependent aminotransferase n=1 Tax=Lutibacter sp. A64 TaxID=2918526 RepID=UPI001F06E7B3|nr:aminotransferase class I/II-fold pyridoxal phosphate-dependent enzyme [Lutibacter sp. A64]UMB53556.1 aminotransferase class I/II-fold pyridoxal phosphate-dependent enzyme [Lutibacter sp. A64]
MIQKADRLNDVKEYYFSKKLREVAALRNEGKPIINIAIGSPDLAPSNSVIAAIQNAVTLPNAHQYQSYQGIPELRSGIADFYKENYNVTLNSATEILPLMGSKEGIMHISMAFLNKGDKVLIPNPGYPTYASVTNLVEAEPILYKLNEATNWLPNFKELEQQDLSNVKIMWINYPHMPTGAVASKEDFKELIAFAKKHQILIVNDNPYSFILNENPLSILEIEGAKEVAIELNSLSKTFNMAGWRVGMVVGDAEIIKTILQVKSNMDSGMFFGIQKGAVEAFKLSSDWFKAQNEIYKRRRAIVWQIFDALNCTYNKNIGGLFVWAKLPEGIKSEDVTDDLLYNKNVFITPGTVFGSNGAGYLRASLCVSEEVLEEVLDRIITVNV